MRHPTPAAISMIKPTTGEKKSDATTRAAQQILDAEKLARETKTERLRQARLAQEQIDGDQPEERAAKAPKRRKGS